MNGWQVKAYGMGIDDRSPHPNLVSAGLRVTEAALPVVPEPKGSLDGYAFCTIHESGERCYLLVHWWAEGNEVHQRLYSTPVGQSGDFAPHASPAVGCVWELAVTDHERRAWLTHVLARPDDPDIDAYLASTISGRY
jgi:hypothetical protein